MAPVRPGFILVHLDKEYVSEGGRAQDKRVLIWWVLPKTIRSLLR